ncbi:hypothetical protein acdb102_35360 [Acidothermaceae bacterium B102]|nr:hypothetical protein acdb102_35360 [Acidothermaceae bacterium B102]
MAAGKPRRAVLRKAADADVHPAEPRVAAKPVRAPARVAAPTSTGRAAARTPGARTPRD